MSAAFDERHADPVQLHGKEPAVLSMPCVDETVIGGIDTHKDLHFAAVIDVTGEVLGERAFANNRMLHHPETRAYVAKRTAEGKTSREIRRCLMRHLARRLFPLLRADLTDAFAISP